MQIIKELSLYNMFIICRDDQIILNGLLFYYGYMKLEQSHYLPLWRTDGIILTTLLHIGPVEFLYYWLHRALHHHFLYSRYHSHHHSSIVTEPITCKSSSIYFKLHILIICNDAPSYSNKNIMTYLIPLILNFSMYVLKFLFLLNIELLRYLS